MKTVNVPVEPTAEYQEHHFQGAHDVGVAWNGNRVWVCLDGQSLLRAKMWERKLFIEFYPPNLATAPQPEQNAAAPPEIRPDKPEGSGPASAAPEPSKLPLSAEEINERCNIMCIDWRHPVRLQALAAIELERVQKHLIKTGRILEQRVKEHKQDALEQFRNCVAEHDRAEKAEAALARYESAEMPEEPQHCRPDGLGFGGMESCESGGWVLATNYDALRTAYAAQTVRLNLATAQLADALKLVEAQKLRADEANRQSCAYCDQAIDNTTRIVHARCAALSGSGGMTDLQKAMKALRIYDTCMDELSFFVGHMRGRCTDNVHDAAITVCERAMKAQKILKQLDKRK